MADFLCFFRSDGSIGEEHADYFLSTILAKSSVVAFLIKFIYAHHGDLLAVFFEEIRQYAFVYAYVYGFIGGFFDVSV